MVKLLQCSRGDVFCGLELIEMLLLGVKMAVLLAFFDLNLMILLGDLTPSVLIAKRASIALLVSLSFFLALGVKTSLSMAAPLATGVEFT